MAFVVVSALKSTHSQRAVEVEFYSRIPVIDGKQCRDDASTTFICGSNIQTNQDKTTQFRFVHQWQCRTNGLLSPR